MTTRETETDLAALVDSSRLREPDAFAGLVRRFQDMAVGYALSILGDLHLAEDASQEAFLEAYRRLDQLREPKAFGSWLRRIVFKRCDRILRRKRPPIVDLDPDRTTRAGGERPDETAEAREMRRHVLDAIRSLPAPLGETTMLFYFGGRTQREIADFLAIPLGTVKSRLHQGRRSLQDRLLALARDSLRARRPSRDRRFEETVMRIIAPEESTHGEALYEFMDSADAHWTPVSPEEYALGRIHDSHYDWKTSRIGTVGGEVVGAWNVYDIAMRIGTSEVRVAGQNGSKIASEHRGTDVERRLAEASFEAARDRGFDLAVTFEHDSEMAPLLGLGYHETWRECWWFVRTRDLPTDPSGVTEPTEFVHYADVPLLADLHNRWNAGVTGTAVRPTFRRTKHPELDAPGLYWTDDAGRPVGYLRPGYHEGPFRHDRQGVQAGSVLSVDDHAGDPDQVVRVIAEMARERGLETVWFIRMGYRSPMGTWLRKHGCFRLNQTTIRYLVRVLNLRQLLEKMRGELERRIAGSSLAGASEMLALHFEDQAATIVIEEGRVRVEHGATGAHSIQGDRAVATLLVGGEDPADVLALPGSRAIGRADVIASALFPNQYPQLGYQDL
jgi:RNA polymerase sigma factor (sigma-70 family)